MKQHCISSISTLCLMSLSTTRSNTFITCSINFKPPVVASIQSIPFALYRLTMKLSCQSVVMHPSEMMSSMRSHTSTAPASPTGASISATIHDCPAALADAILLKAFVITSKVIGSLGPSTGLSSDRSSGLQGNSTLRKRSQCSSQASFFGSSFSESWSATF